MKPVDPDPEHCIRTYLPAPDLPHEVVEHLVHVLTRLRRRFNVGNLQYRFNKVIQRGAPLLKKEQFKMSQIFPSL